MVSGDVPLTSYFTRKSTTSTKNSSKSNKSGSSKKKRKSVVADDDDDSHNAQEPVKKKKRISEVLDDDEGVLVLSKRKSNGEGREETPPRKAVNEKSKQQKALDSRTSSTESVIDLTSSSPPRASKKRPSLSSSSGAKSKAATSSGHFKTPALPIRWGEKSRTSSDDVEIVESSQTQFLSLPSDKSKIKINSNASADEEIVPSSQSQYLPLLSYRKKSSTDDIPTSPTPEQPPDDDEIVPSSQTQYISLHPASFYARERERLVIPRSQASEHELHRPSASNVGLSVVTSPPNGRERSNSDIVPSSQPSADDVSWYGSLAAQRSSSIEIPDRTLNDVQDGWRPTNSLLPSLPPSSQPESIDIPLATSSPIPSRENDIMDSPPGPNRNQHTSPRSYRSPRYRGSPPKLKLKGHEISNSMAPSSQPSADDVSWYNNWNMRRSGAKEEHEQRQAGFEDGWHPTSSLLAGLPPSSQPGSIPLVVTSIEENDIVNSSSTPHHNKHTSPTSCHSPQHRDSPRKLSPRKPKAAPAQDDSETESEDELPLPIPSTSSLPPSSKPPSEPSSGIHHTSGPLSGSVAPPSPIVTAHVPKVSGNAGSSWDADNESASQDPDSCSSSYFGSSYETLPDFIKDFRDNFGNE